jgi:hypothetical protein
MVLVEIPHVVIGGKADQNAIKELFGEVKAVLTALLKPLLKRYERCSMMREIVYL